MKVSRESTSEDEAKKCGSVQCWMCRSVHSRQKPNLLWKERRAVKSSPPFTPSTARGWVMMWAGDHDEFQRSGW
jgi:hypothetical protein